MTDVTFRNDGWLAAERLTKDNVMAYFASSNFYNRSCKNSYVSMQRTAFSFEDPGLEYILEVANEEGGVFVISAQYRESATMVVPKAVYYIVDGCIYQAPDMYTVIEKRTRNALYHLEKALSAFSRVDAGDFS